MGTRGCKVFKLMSHSGLEVLPSTSTGTRLKCAFILQVFQFVFSSAVA